MLSEALGREKESRLALAVASFLLAFCLYKVVSIQIAAAGNRWMTGDWLINYSAGFVRRGLLGEAARSVQAAFGLGSISFIIGVKVLAYSAYLGGLFLLIRKKGIGLLEAFLLFSPWFLLFDLYDSGGSGRKEILLLAAYVLFIQMDGERDEEDGVYWSRGEVWFMALAFPLLALIHEGLVFFYPFFFLHAVARNGRPTLGETLPFAIPFGLSLALVGVLFLFFRGDAAMASDLCRNLMATGIPDTLCTGGIEALGGFGFQVDRGLLANYIPTASITLLSLIGYARLAYPGASWGRLLGSFLLVAPPTLPLYVMAADWGRWIHVTAVMLFLALLAGRRVERLRWNRIPIRPSALVLYAILAWMYLFHWKLPHYVPPGSDSIWFREDYRRMVEALLRF